MLHHFHLVFFPRLLRTNLIETMELAGFRSPAGPVRMADFKFLNLVNTTWRGLPYPFATSTPVSSRLHCQLRTRFVRIYIPAIPWFITPYSPQSFGV